MRVFRSIIAPSPAFMVARDTKITCGRAVRSQIIGHELVWYKAHFLEQFPHQFQGSPLVPLALHKNLEDFAFGIDGAPQVNQPAIDCAKCLIKMPGRMRLGPAPSKISCDRRSEVFHPPAHRLVGDQDPAFGQQILDIAEAEGEPSIEPDGLLNDHGREAISDVADGHDKGLRAQVTAGKPNNVTMPPEALIGRALAFVNKRSYERALADVEEALMVRETIEGL